MISQYRTILQLCQLARERDAATLGKIRTCIAGFQRALERLDAEARQVDPHADPVAQSLWVRGVQAKRKDWEARLSDLRRKEAAAAQALARTTGRRDVAEGLLNASVRAARQAGEAAEEDQRAVLNALSRVRGPGERSR